MINFCIIIQKVNFKFFFFRRRLYKNTGREYNKKVHCSVLEVVYAYS